MLVSSVGLLAVGRSNHAWHCCHCDSSKPAVCSPPPPPGVVGPGGGRDGLVIGTFLLWALVYLYFLPIYSPLEPVGPQKPCVTPLRDSRRRRG